MNIYKFTIDDNLIYWFGIIAFGDLNDGIMMVLCGIPKDMMDIFMMDT